MKWCVSSRLFVSMVLVAVLGGRALAAPEIAVIKADGSGDYTTLQAWWDAVKLSTNPEQWAEVHSGGSVGTLDWSAKMPNAVTSSEAHPLVYAAPGQRHEGRIPADPATVACCGKIKFSINSNFEIDGLYICATNDFAMEVSQGSLENQYVNISNCLVRRTISNNTAGQALKATIYYTRYVGFFNNIFTVDGKLDQASDLGVVDFTGGSNPFRGKFIHNTVVTTLPLRGFRSNSKGADFYNNVVIAGGTAFDCKPDKASNNASSDLTAQTALGGTGNLTNVSGYHQFLDIASDWQLRATADLRDAATEQLEVDAVGRLRPNGVASDIGALEWYPSEDPVFLLQNPITASGQYTGTNTLTVVEVVAPVGYTHCQITTSDTAPTGGTWRDLANDPPAEVTFARPQFNGPIAFYAWFGDANGQNIAPEPLEQTLIYTTAKPDLKPQDLTYYMSLSPTTIHVTHVDAGSSGGYDAGIDIGLYKLEITCDDEEADVEPDKPGITLDKPGEYTFRLAGMNWAGNSDSETCTVTILAADPEIAIIDPTGHGDYTTLQAWWDVAKLSKNPAQWAEVRAGGSVGNLSWTPMPELVAPNTVVDTNAFPKIYAAAGQRHAGRIPDDPDKVARSGRIATGSYFHIGEVEGMYIHATNTIPFEISDSTNAHGPFKMTGCLVHRTITDDKAGPAIKWTLYQDRSFNLYNNIVLVDGSLSTASTTGVVNFGGNNPYNGQAINNTIITALPLRGFQSAVSVKRGVLHNNVAFVGGDQAFAHQPTSASHNASNDASADEILGGTGNLINLPLAGLFIDASCDWRLPADSALVNAGLMPPLLLVDAVGTVRPQGDAVDIGAIEYQRPGGTVVIIR